MSTKNRVFRVYGDDNEQALIDGGARIMGENKGRYGINWTLYGIGGYGFVLIKAGHVSSDKLAGTDSVNIMDDEEYTARLYFKNEIERTRSEYGTWSDEFRKKYDDAYKYYSDGANGRTLRVWGKGANIKRGQVKII